MCKKIFGGLLLIAIFTVDALPTEALAMLAVVMVIMGAAALYEMEKEAQQEKQVEINQKRRLYYAEKDAQRDARGHTGDAAAVCRAGGRDRAEIAEGLHGGADNRGDAV